MKTLEAKINLILLSLLANNLSRAWFIVSLGSFLFFLFKILVRDSGKSVAVLSKNRGTAINTISSNYDVKNQEAVKAQTAGEKKLNKKKLI